MILRLRILASPVTQRYLPAILLSTTLILLFASASRSQAPAASRQTAVDLLSSNRMLADIRVLSAPTFNGRLAGSHDDALSAIWVAQELAAAGLSLPLINNGTTTFPFVSGKHGKPLGVMASNIPTSTIQPNPVLRIGSADQITISNLGADYLPVFDSPSANAQGRIIFVGYGIADPTHGIDDYAGVNATNRIVLFLRGKPTHYQHPVSHADKARFARDHGALAYLTATGPVLNAYDAKRGVTGTPSAFYGQLPPEQAIPGAWISTARAEQILAGSDKAKTDRLRVLQEQLNTTASSQSQETDQYASLDWNTVTQEGLLTNVVGLIPGTGPDAIIIGAHRDHFGRPAGLLFPGADDNASGTAVMLEVARALAKSGLRPQRTILFISFSGEERGLLGSRLYTTRPIIPLNAAGTLPDANPAIRPVIQTGSTKAMINIDHAGIGNGRLTVGVSGLEKTVATTAGQAAELANTLDVYGFFPGGDHVPFKEAGVPTITVVSGGIHPHYHQPTDTVDTINPDILMTTARYILTLAWQLANEP